MHGILAVIALVAGLWALLVWLTSGFIVSIAGIKIVHSSTRQFEPS